jgi:hypothetical protein
MMLRTEIHGGILAALQLRILVASMVEDIFLGLMALEERLSLASSKVGRAQRFHHCSKRQRGLQALQ